MHCLKATQFSCFNSKVIEKLGNIPVVFFLISTSKCYLIVTTFQTFQIVIKRKKTLINGNDRE